MINKLRLFHFVKLSNAYILKAWCVFYSILFQINISNLNT